MAPKAAPPTSTRQTRAATGHSAPRVFAKVEEAVAKPTKKRTTKQSTTSKTIGKDKANTSKPRTKKSTTGAGVKKAPAKKTTAAKPKKTSAKVGATKTKSKKESGLIADAVDYVKGAALEVEGVVTGKSGKKVRISQSHVPTLSICSSWDAGVSCAATSCHFRQLFEATCFFCPRRPNDVESLTNTSFRLLGPPRCVAPSEQKHSSLSLLVTR